MSSEEEPVIGFAGALAWLVGMTVVIAILSEYIVATIEVKFATLYSHTSSPSVCACMRVFVDGCGFVFKDSLRLHIY